MPSPVPIVDLAEWRSDEEEPLGARDKEWMAAPGFTDSVEWSPDLTQWFPYANSLRLNGPVAGPVVYETPAGGSGPRYFRVRRAY